MFAEDNVICSETEKQVEESLERGRILVRERNGCP